MSCRRGTTFCPRVVHTVQVKKIARSIGCFHHKTHLKRERSQRPILSIRRCDRLHFQTEEAESWTPYKLLWRGVRWADCCLSWITLTTLSPHYWPGSRAPSQTDWISSAATWTDKGNLTCPLQLRYFMTNETPGSSCCEELGLFLYFQLHFFFSFLCCTLIG